MTSNNKYWLLVVLAACIEVVWVIGLKHANHFAQWAGTALAIGISFALLLYTSKKLPTSTVYAVFVGLGTAGSVIAEMMLFDVPFRWSKIAFIALLLIGVIGLKIVTPERSDGAGHNRDTAATAAETGGKIS